MVRLITYNIEYCEGMKGLWWEYLKFWRIFFPPKDLDQRIINALKKVKPDILALVEVDTGSFRAKKDEVKYFEKKLRLKDFTEKVKYSFEGWTKLFHHVPILNKQANAIIAKYRLSQVKYHLFHEGTKRVIIEATIHVPQKVTLLLAHLALGEKTRANQLKELANIVNKIKNPVILMGDFNTFNGKKEINKLLKKTHLHTAARMAHKSRIYTEPAVHPTRRLDYVLVSKRIKVKSYEVLKFPFSDHLPIMVDFKVK